MSHVGQGDNVCRIRHTRQHYAASVSRSPGLSLGCHDSLLDLVRISRAPSPSSSLSGHYRGWPTPQAQYSATGARNGIGSLYRFGICNWFLMHVVLGVHKKPAVAGLLFSGTAKQGQRVA